MSDYSEITGFGLKHPLELLNGAAVLISGHELVQQSISLLLSESIRERFFNRRVGARVREALFLQNSAATEAVLYVLITEAFKKWEPRVNFVGANFTAEGSKLTIEMRYLLRGTSEVTSFTYPFYRNLKY